MNHKNVKAVSLQRWAIISFKHTDSPLTLKRILSNIVIFNQ